MPRKSRNLSDALVNQIRDREDAEERSKAVRMEQATAKSKNRAMQLFQDVEAEIPLVIDHCLANNIAPHVFTVFVTRWRPFGNSHVRLEKAGWTVLSWTQDDLGPKYDTASQQRSWSITADGWLVDPGRGRLTRKKLAGISEADRIQGGINEAALATVLKNLRSMRGIEPLA